jgi:hypothetical protein
MAPWNSPIVILRCIKELLMARGIIGLRVYGKMFTILGVLKYPLFKLVN